MSIEFERIKVEMTMSCDACGESEDFNGDFQDCINDAKEAGWWITKTGPYWEHYCPGCKQEIAQEETQG